jgi:hypothetical protein
MSVAEKPYAQNDILGIFTKNVFTPREWYDKVFPVVPIPTTGLVEGIMAHDVRGVDFVADSRYVPRQFDLPHSDTPNCDLIVSRVEGKLVPVVAATQNIAVGDALTVNWWPFTRRLKDYKLAIELELHDQRRSERKAND